ncbi:MAG: AraC family transcriptional regulator [Pleurocapsa sp. MO_226.B13]|nr:AraC family transcriptional regulator [Pleurocapsa sp. MO_226.B13]
MLRCSELAIADIGYQVGYKNPSHFARVFRKHIKLTPWLHLCHLKTCIWMVIALIHTGSVNLPWESCAGFATASRTAPTTVFLKQLNDLRLLMPASCFAPFPFL